MDAGDVDAGDVDAGDVGAVGANCPACGTPVEEEHRYCERCGHDLHAVPPAQLIFLSSTAEFAACGACGSNRIGSEGYCEHCGQRRVAGQDRAELELAGVAGVTDRGHHRRHNEDAVAIGRVDGAAGGLTAAVVCDGVSSSSRADAAACAAVNAAMGALAGTLPGIAASPPPGTAASPPPGASPADAITAATEAAATAVAVLGDVESGHNPPSCTYVAAVVSAAEITVGWVGDSRAYWLAPVPADSLALTADDSLAGQLTTAGAPPAAAAGADPRALALLRWLGADATDTAPHLNTFTPTGPGRVLLCSDGLSRYLPEPARLAAVVSTVDPLEAAKLLTQVALDSGGHDNIAVAVLPFPPPPPPLPSSLLEAPGGSTP